MWATPSIEGTFLAMSVRPMADLPVHGFSATEVAHHRSSYIYSIYDHTDVFIQSLMILNLARKNDTLSGGPFLLAINNTGHLWAQDCELVHPVCSSCLPKGFHGWKTRFGSWRYLVRGLGHPRGTWPASCWPELTEPRGTLKQGTKIAHEDVERAGLWRMLS